MPCITPSSRLSLDSSSPSGGLRGRLFARSGAGNMHCTFALAQFEHGYCLLQRTLRRRHIMHDRGLSAGLPCGAEDVALVGVELGLSGS